MHQIRFSAGAVPQTPLEELTHCLLHTVEYTKTFFRLWPFDEYLDDRWFIVICSVRICVRGPTKYLGL